MRSAVPLANVLSAAVGMLGWVLEAPQLVPLAALLFCLVSSAAWLVDVFTEPSRAKGEDDAYELLDLLGEGTMGKVWRVRHKRLGRVSALKTIRPQEADAEDLARFAREARVMASLGSPHTAVIHDFGTRVDGSFFYAMEFLNGVDLQQLVTRFGALSPARAIHVLEQICQSLEEAHQHGLVHRDLKPSNVMLCEHGGEVDVVKVLDFGLAKELRARGAAANITRTSVVLGTAAYMAPESLKGSARVDTRADIYALGCVAFWLLTGQLLFQHQHPVAMAKAHAHESPRTLRELAPSAPLALDELVTDCLSKAPHMRPQTVAEVRRRLALIGDLPAWGQPQARDWWKTHRPSAVGL